MEKEVKCFGKAPHRRNFLRLETPQKVVLEWAPDPIQNFCENPANKRPAKRDPGQKPLLPFPLTRGSCCKVGRKLARCFSGNCSVRGLLLREAQRRGGRRTKFSCGKPNQMGFHQNVVKTFSHRLKREWIPVL